MRGRRGAVTALLVAAVALAAAGLTFAAGRRGLFPLDQSILFDGGYRVLRGQVPFRDFVLPVGPLAVWLQGALFALFGVSWRGYLLSAALVSAVAVVVSFLLARRLVSGGRWWPLLAAAGTGAWFLAPSGTPWMDAPAYLLVLLALLALLRDGGGLVSDGAAGALVLAAFLCKQNAAVAALPLLAAPFALRWAVAGRLPWWRPAACLAGAAVAAGLFTGWLVLFAEPALFVEHVLRLPSAAGWERLAERPGRALFTAFTGAGPRPLRATLLLAVVPALAVLSGLSGRSSGERLPAAAVAAGLFLAHNLFLATANNQPEISLPYAGLAVALGGWLVWRQVGDLSDRARRRTRWPVAAVVSVGAAVVLAGGADASLSRRVHEGVPAGASFARPLTVPGLEGLLWAEPTCLQEGWAGRPRGAPAAAVEAAHVGALVTRLRHDGRPFFVFPDWTLLYGVVGAPPPQPLLWFHPGLTYPRGGDPRLDRWIVAELERRGVSTVVLEEVSWFGTDRRLADFPRLAAWIDRCCVETERIGPFRVLERRPGR